MVEKDPRNLKELLNQGYVFPSVRPEGMSNLFSLKGTDYRKDVLDSRSSDSFDSGYYRSLKGRDELLDVSKLDSLDHYVGFFVKDDYAGKSPAMFNSLFDKLGLNYGAFMFVADPNDSEVIFEALRNDEKFLGGGLGVGFKEKFEFLDGVFPEGIMSVNNLVRYGGNGRRKIVGYNTDASGFVSGLQKKFGEVDRASIDGRNIVVLGAGAIAGDIVMELGSRGAKRVSVLNRTVSKTEVIRDRVNARYSGLVSSGGEDKIASYLLGGDSVDAVINVSTKGGDGPLNSYSAFASADSGEEGLSRNLEESAKIVSSLKETNPEIIVADVQQKDTPTLKLGREGGLTHLLNGNDMVVRQGVDAVMNINLGNDFVFGEDLEKDYVFEVFDEVVSNV